MQINGIELDIPEPIESCIAHETPAILVWACAANPDLQPPFLVLCIPGHKTPDGKDRGLAVELRDTAESLNNIHGAIELLLSDNKVSLAPVCQVDH